MKFPQYDNRPGIGEALYSDPNQDDREAKGTFLAIAGVICFLGFLFFGIGGGLTMLMNALRALLH